MRHFKILGVFIILVSVSSFQFSSEIETNIKTPTSDSSTHWLTLYGKYIYQHESCANCHSLVDTEQSGYISLDGLSGKYPNSWHYNHLLEPQMMVPDSKMPVYAYLIDKPLNQQTFNAIIDQSIVQPSAINPNTLWQILHEEAQYVANDLKKYGIENTQSTEILAIIAYLQKIPASPIRRQKDSIITAEYKKKQQIWDQVLIDSNQVVMKNALDKTNIPAGKIIFKNNCSACHGIDGEGLIGPNLTDEYWINGAKLSHVINTIVNGIPEKGMMAWRNQLTPLEVGQVTSYIFSIKGSKPKHAKQKQGMKE